MDRLSKTVVLVLLSVWFSAWQNSGYAQRKEVISSKNEFGGQTIEYRMEDFSILTVFFDSDGNKAKEEIIYTSDYPIDNNLSRFNTYYTFGKKTKEERIYSRSFASRTLINRSIDHFDRNTGEMIKRENHFVNPFSEYNVIYRENGKKTRVEWHYPDNLEGLMRNVSYLNDDERVFKTESFYTEKTVLEEGYTKRVYFIEYNLNKYLRKSRQEWYFTADYAEANHGVYKKVELFHYALGKPVRNEILFYDQHDNLIKREQ